MGMQNGTAILEDCVCFLEKLNLLWPYDPAVALLGICPKELKTYVHTKICTQVFVVHCPVTKLCPTLCDPMNCSTPGFPVLHHLLEFSQTHVHWVDDAIQPSHPLLTPPPHLLLPSIFPSIRVFSTQVFIAVLFIIAKSQKQSGCSSVGEWINKQWYI